MAKTTSRTITLQDLQPGLKIDRDDLDREIAVQADTYYRVADACTMALSRRDEAKLLMEDEASRAALRVRSDAAGKDEKITEAFVKEQSGRDRDFLEARTAYLKAKGEADAWTNMREAYEMRSKMLKELAELQIAGYYQASAVGGGRQRQVSDIAYESNRAALQRERATRG